MASFVAAESVSLRVLLRREGGGEGPAVNADVNAVIYGWRESRICEVVECKTGVPILVDKLGEVGTGSEPTDDEEEDEDALVEEMCEEFVPVAVGGRVRDAEEAEREGARRRGWLLSRVSPATDDVGA